MELKKYLPSTVRSVREFNEIADTEESEFALLRIAANSVSDNQFILSLDANGCKRWEKILKINPMDTDTINERRFRILSRINEKLPYTYRTIEDRVKQLCGEENYSIDMDKKGYKLSVRVGLTAKKNAQSVTDMLDRITPCNLILFVGLLYNTNDVLGTKTYGELESYTCQELREEAIG